MRGVRAAAPVRQDVGNGDVELGRALYRAIVHGKVLSVGGFDGFQERRSVVVGRCAPLQRSGQPQDAHASSPERACQNRLQCWMVCLALAADHGAPTPFQQG